jgi:redox-sensitive bicupin YhaK (pirin superfamily)
MPITHAAVNSPRALEHLVTGRATSDGAGVKLTRLLTDEWQQRLDPFLMLDAFGSDKADDYIAGFPDHPHRGFETITYMIAGRMRHRDSAGNEGLLQNGGVQWMTAGRGVIHSELPEQEEGRMEGFQLWLNLPAKDKMCAPWYRDFQADDLPAFETPEGVQVTVIAGQSRGVSGGVQRDATDVLYLVLHWQRDAVFEQPLPATHNAFVVAYEGDVRLGDTALPVKHMAVLANTPGADGVRLQGRSGACAILVAGKPLGEPIVQYGPFVMNSQAEIITAINDYRSGQLA